MKTSLFRRCALLGSLLSGLGGAGCGATDPTTLILSISNLSGDIHTLWLSARMTGTQTLKEYPAAPMIGLELLPGASGQVELAVGGLSYSGCWVATAEGRIRVNGEPLVDVNVELGPCDGSLDCCSQ